MKKYLVKIIAVVLAITVCLLLAGCGKQFAEEITAKDIMSVAIASGNAPEYEKVYCPSETVLTSKDMSLWADSKYVECTEFSMLEDYAIYISAGVVSYEIAVLKVTDAQHIESLMQVIERRKETLSQGDKGFYDKNFKTRMEQSQLYSDGDFVIFLMTEDNDSAKQAINKLKK